MPTYGYRCTACGHEFERIQKITEPALTECETCNGLVKKMIYPVGIQFVGSGFYVNDYNKSSGGSTGSKANGNGSGGSESAPLTSTTESKTTESSAAASTPAPAAPAASSGGDSKQ